MGICLSVLPCIILTGIVPRPMDNAHALFVIIGHNIVYNITNYYTNLIWLHMLHICTCNLEILVMYSCRFLVICPTYLSLSFCVPLVGKKEHRLRYCSSLCRNFSSGIQIYVAFLPSLQISVCVCANVDSFIE